MNKQFKDLLELYKKYIDIFNNWTNDRETLKDYNRLVRIYLELTDILLENGIIERYNAKKYRVIESGEII